MKPKVAVYGAGHLGEFFSYEYHALGKYRDYEFVGFIDDNKEGVVGAAHILGTRRDLPRLRDEGVSNIIVFLLKEPKKRLEICLELEKQGFQFPPLNADFPSGITLGKGIICHPSACYLGNSGIIEDFSVIGPFVTIEGGSKLGKGVILSPYSFVGHDASIGNASVLYPRASVMPGICIGKECVIGPHVVQHHNLNEYSRHMHFRS